MSKVTNEIMTLGTIRDRQTYIQVYSHHIKDKGNDGADDNKSVHQVPYVAEIGTRMGNHTQINDLNDHLGDDGQVFNGHEKITFKSISIAKIPVKT